MTAPPAPSVAAIGTSLRAGETTSVALTEQLLARIAAIDGDLRAFVLVTKDRALEDARRADAELRAGLDRGPMHGVPYALKDVVATAGIPTSCHSKLRLGHVPAEDADVERRLREGGGVLLGKLATHEFALGGPSEELPFPPARNPWNVDHVPGASSSGSGVAVAAGLVPVAIGSDTSGSIRGPAFHCGTVGLKPTFGLVSRRGVFPLSFSLDHVGPLTSTVTDAALVMRVIAGYDRRDLGSGDSEAPDFTGRMDESLEGLSIGYARDLFAGRESTSREVVRTLDNAAKQLSALGARVEEVSLPTFDLFNACGRIIMTAEGYSIHERDLRERPRDYGRFTYQRLAPGATISAADLLSSLRLRRKLAHAVNEGALKHHQVLLTANGLAPAARFTDFPSDWPPPGPASAMNTIPFNVTGNPALAVPAGFFTSGLPLGIQLVGRPRGEPTLFQVGAAWERTYAGPLRWEDSTMTRGTRAYS